MVSRLGIEPRTYLTKNISLFIFYSIRHMTF